MSNSDSNGSTLILKTEDSFPKELLPHIDIIFDDTLVKHGLSEISEIKLPSEETKDLCLHVGGIEIYRESITTFDGIDVELKYDLMVPVNITNSRKFTLIFDSKSLPYLCDYFYHGSTKYSLPFESKENIKFELLILDEKKSKKLIFGDEKEGDVITIEDNKNDLFIEVEEEEIDSKENQPIKENIDSVKENYSSASNENSSKLETLESKNQFNSKYEMNNNLEIKKYEDDNSEGFVKVYGRMNVKKVARLGLNPKELYEGNITSSSNGIEYQVTINETGNTVLKRIQSNRTNIIKPLLFIAGGAALMLLSGKDNKDESKTENKQRAIDPVIIKNPKDTKTNKINRRYTVRKTK